MADILEKGVQGYVKFYKIEDGWGFIKRQDNIDVFFHASNLLCTPPYASEAIVFDIKRSSSGTHEYEAVNVSRVAGERVTGDVLEWRVEPGSWRTEGSIMPSGNASPIPFSARDLKGTGGKLVTKPRPWHAATFSIVQTNEGPSPSLPSFMGRQ